MTDEGKRPDNEVTPEGAVEIAEQALDAASGGLLPASGETSVKIDFCRPETSLGGPHVSEKVKTQDFHLSGKKI